MAPKRKASQLAAPASQPRTRRTKTTQSAVSATPPRTTRTTKSKAALQKAFDDFLEIAHVDSEEKIDRLHALITTAERDFTDDNTAHFHQLLASTRSNILYLDDQDRVRLRCCISTTGTKRDQKWAQGILDLGQDSERSPSPSPKRSRTLIDYMAADGKQTSLAKIVQKCVQTFNARVKDGTLERAAVPDRQKIEQHVYGTHFIDRFTELRHTVDNVTVLQPSQQDCEGVTWATEHQHTRELYQAFEMLLQYKRAGATKMAHAFYANFYHLQIYAISLKIWEAHTSRNDALGHLCRRLVMEERQAGAHADKSDEWVLREALCRGAPGGGQRHAEFRESLELGERIGRVTRIFGTEAVLFLLKPSWFLGISADAITIIYTILTDNRSGIRDFSRRCLGVHLLPCFIGPNAAGKVLDKKVWAPLLETKPQKWRGPNLESITPLAPEDDVAQALVNLDRTTVLSSVHDAYVVILSAQAPQGNPAYRYASDSKSKLRRLGWKNDQIEEVVKSLESSKKIRISDKGNYYQIVGPVDEPMEDASIELGNGDEGSEHAKSVAEGRADSANDDEEEEQEQEEDVVVEVADDDQEAAVDEGGVDDGDEGADEDDEGIDARLERLL